MVKVYFCHRFYKNNGRGLPALFKKGSQPFNCNNTGLLF